MLKLKAVFSLVLGLYFGIGFGQSNTEKMGPSSIDKPKLIVGIVVDQMRYDYLTRFQAKYGAGGFNRLVEEGFNCNVIGLGCYSSSGR